ncbi:aldehyde dehydrogenase family protein [Streptomyces sp. NPDC057137]|uniref:aldehyde dehydrogenase family protein n=1 Tax=Streptomyces sp. NPDC057137 TaxID=3346030 RepID=UPI0036312F95
MDSRYEFQFIGGEWVRPGSESYIEVVNPATEKVIARVPRGNAADGEQAVRAARAAFPAWAATPLKERVELLRRAAELLEERTDSVARTISEDVGTPLTLARAVQVGYPVRVLRAFCDVAHDVPWQQKIRHTLVVREPAGVVVAITPWNYPLHQTAAKIGAALLAGCTVVLKPSELAPLSVYALIEVFRDAGLPSGVLNMVLGYGDEVGEPLVVHPEVDVVTFTGSTAVGAAITRAAADGVKRVTLELGGKSPSVILDGADLDRATAGTVARCFGNSGQTCAALTRLIVPRHLLAQVEERVAAAVGALTIGDPLDAGTDLGPLVSAAQRGRVEALIRSGIDEGARPVALPGERRLPDSGFYVSPVVFSDVRSHLRVAQEEIFGPVLCLLPYDDVDEAVAIANGTPYGLASAVWGPPDPAVTTAVARRLAAGMVGVNGGRLNLAAPFGGYKASGRGREFGALGIEEFLEVKAVNFLSDDDIWWAEPTSPS